MDIDISVEERVAYLTLMAGSGNRVLSDVYSQSDEVTRDRILAALATSMAQLEGVMDDFGIGRDPEGIARGMMLTEDLIGCEPKGELLAASPTEAVRKVTFCPWAPLFAADGSTCRLILAAVEAGLGKKYGVSITCEQSMAEGADCCIWKVRQQV